MPPPEATVDHYRTQRALSRRTTEKVLDLWRGLDPADLDGSWAVLRDRIFVQVSAGQLVAAAQADGYLDAVLDEQGMDPVRSASVRPRAFAGVAADGRSLDTLLLEPLISVKVGIAQGLAVPDALQSGAASMVKIVGTELADAGRTAVGTGMVARPAVTTWTRYLSPPSCSRCVVLAGKVYKFNQGFSRHPHCKCQHAPTSEVFADELVTDPRKYFDSLAPAEQDKYFGPADAEAIRSGADVSQVVNAGRKGGMYQANGRKFTTEGTTKRGVAGTRSPGVPRPAPETIIEDATDRDEMLAMLRQFGYIA